MDGLAGITAFSLLMDVITLMLGQGLDSRASAANKALVLALLASNAALLFALGCGKEIGARTVARSTCSCARSRDATRATRPLSESRGGSSCQAART